jgi:glycosyltransferase involved in cell wall biosynthesis
MKILVDALSAREGGGVTYIRHALPALARAATAEGHQVHVLLSPRYQQDLIAGLPANMHLCPVDLPATGLVRRLVFLQTRVNAILRRESFDVLFTVVEVGAIRPPCAHVVMARNLSIYAPVATVRDVGDRLELLLFRLTRQPLARLTIRAAEQVVCVSDAFRELVLHRTGIEPARTHVVHHGVDAAFRQNDSAVPDASHPALMDSPYVLCVSTVAPHKNYETLLDAWARLPRVDEQPLLAIAGSIADRRLHDQLLARAASLSISERVRFLGRVRHDRLPSLYHRAAAFVFPSRLETFGLPLVEAMAAGVPIVASALPVCREICGDSALYFDASSPEELSTLLTAVLEDESLRASMAKSGLRRAADFSWDRTAQRMLAIFHEAVERRSRRV